MRGSTGAWRRSCGMEVLAVDIYSIADGLESVEADSHWQDDIQEWYIALQEDIEKVDTKVSILEIQKWQQVD